VKAWYVERIGRTVTLMVVHADSAADAKRRSAEHGVATDSFTDTRGFGGVERAPAYDDRELPSHGIFTPAERPQETP
jgi:hypothetical protein